MRGSPRIALVSGTRTSPVPNGPALGSRGTPSQRHGTGHEHFRVMSRTDDGSGVAKRAQAVGRLRLSSEVVGENRESVVIEARGEVGDVAAEYQPLTDADRLVAGCVTGCEEQLDRSVA